VEKKWGRRSGIVTAIIYKPYYDRIMVLDGYYKNIMILLFACPILLGIERSAPSEAHSKP
jgi:hypothetical protein